MTLVGIIKATDCREGDGLTKIGMRGGMEKRRDEINGWGVRKRE